MRIFCAFVLTLIFIIFVSSVVSAEISSNDIVDENYDFAKLKNFFILEVDMSSIDMPLGAKLSDRDRIRFYEKTYEVSTIKSGLFTIRE